LLTPWTDEIVARLRQHWLEGVSVTESRDAINAEFGTQFTRNATIGKRHRLDLTDQALIELVGADSPIAKKVKDREAARLCGTKQKVIRTVGGLPKKLAKCRLGSARDAARRERSQKAREKAVMAFGGNGHSIGLLELTSLTCRWPVDEGDTTMFCGCLVKEGKPYCPLHCEKAYEKRGVGNFGMKSEKA